MSTLHPQAEQGNVFKVFACVHHGFLIELSYQSLRSSTKPLSPNSHDMSYNYYSDLSYIASKETATPATAEK